MFHSRRLSKCSAAGKDPLIRMYRATTIDEARGELGHDDLNDMNRWKNLNRNAVAARTLKWSPE